MAQISQPFSHFQVLPAVEIKNNMSHSSVGLEVTSKNTFTYNKNSSEGSASVLCDFMPSVLPTLPIYSLTVPDAETLQAAGNMAETNNSEL
jgi:hypothetical protein